MSQDDAYKYWQSKLKSGDKNAKKDQVSSDNDDDFDDDDEDAKLGEELSGSEVKFSEPTDQDDDYSMNEDDDFQISSSFKQAQFGMDKSLNNTSQKKTAKGETTSAAKENLNKILEEEKKQSREARLKQLMAEQKAQIRK